VIENRINNNTTPTLNRTAEMRHFGHYTEPPLFEACTAKLNIYAERRPQLFRSTEMRLPMEFQSKFIRLGSSPTQQF